MPQLTKLPRTRIVQLGLVAVVVLAAVLVFSGSAAGGPPIQLGGSLGLVCTEDSAEPSGDGGVGTPTFDLQAMDGYLATPDGNSLYMWGYTLNPGTFQMPGPILCIDEGDTVTVNLTNNLPEPTSIVFPGQSGVATTGGTTGLLTAEAAASGGTVSYTFTASHPGTYLYESGTELHKQVQMGLHGAIVVRPALGAGYAYNDPATAFDEEFIILLHDIDPNLHLAVERGEPYDVTTRWDRYWTINGRSMPDTLNDNNIPWMPAQPYGALVRVEAFDGLGAGTTALVRYSNAGTVNHPFHPHGDHLTVIAQDGRPLGAASIDTFTRTIGAGQSADLLFTWDAVDGFATGGDPVPVQLPGINDSIYKDGVTFYSGDPVLGETGDLPVGTTTYNQCGEYYFPWHSHALNEFQNFDEGFGGMGTLVRVEPPGGCP